MNTNHKSLRPILPSWAAIMIGLLCLAAGPRQAPAADSLLEFLPRTTNWFLHVEDIHEFGERYGDGDMGRIYKTDEFEPVRELLAEIPTEGYGPLVILQQLDMAKLLPLVEGDFLIFNSHYGDLKDVELESYHFDTVIIFEHDGRQKQIQELFEAAIGEVPAGAEKERDKIGDYTMRRIHWLEEVESVTGYEENPNYNPQDENSRPYIFTTEMVPAPYDFQYVVNEDLAMFAEGSNIPLPDALNAAVKQRDRFLDREEVGALVQRLELGDSLAQGIAFGFRPEAYAKVWEERRIETTPLYELFKPEGVTLALAHYDEREEEYSLRIGASIARGEPGLWGFASYLGPVSRDLFDLVPEYADSGAVFRFRMGDALEALLARLREIEPEFETQLTAAKTFLQAQIGIDLFADFLFLLGDEGFGFTQEATAPDFADRIVTALSLKDARAVEANLKKAVQTLETANPALGEYIETQRHENAEIYLVMRPDFETGEKQVVFAFGVAGRFLLMGSDAAIVKAGAESAAGKVRPLTREREVGRLLKSVPEDAAYIGVSRGGSFKHEDLRGIAFMALQLIQQLGIGDAEALYEAQQELLEDAEEGIAFETETLSAYYLVGDAEYLLLRSEGRSPDS